MAPVVSRTPPRLNDSHLRAAMEEFRFHPSLETASEIVEGSIVLGQEPLAGPAAKYLFEHSNARDASRGLARIILQGKAHESVSILGTSLDQIRIRIAYLKSVLIEYPNNPIAWIALARSYVALGQNDRAERAIQAALVLAPTYRYVLRSASRYFIHLRDPGRALAILDRSPVTIRDPWLLSAQLAIAQVAGESPRNVKVAERMAESRSFSSRQISELTSALGGLELLNGRQRFARRYFKQSLIDPTENALAQAIWTQKILPHMDIPLDPLQSAQTYEANARRALAERRWPDSVNACRAWLEDEPFSSRPAVLGSFICAVALEDFITSELMCRKGLQANPRHDLLTNNLVVSLACLGRIEEAQATLSALASGVPDGETNITLTATRGLVAFRAGRVNEGRLFYDIAIARIQSNQRLKALAMLHYALEELRVDLKRGQVIGSEAEKSAIGVDDPAIQILKDRLKARLAKAAEESKRYGVSTNKK